MRRRIGCFVRRIHCVIGLTVACSAQIRDTAAVPRIPRNRLRADVIGCYEMTLQPSLPKGHESDLVALERMELDSTPVFEGNHNRRVHAERSAFARAYPVQPSIVGPVHAVWSADSLTDSLTVFAAAGTGYGGARVVLTIDGGLEGTAYHSWEYGHAELGPVAWKRRSCEGLDLDRATP